jgi:hypothetical protein
MSNICVAKQNEKIFEHHKHQQMEQICAKETNTSIPLTGDVWTVKLGRY